MTKNDMNHKSDNLQYQKIDFNNENETALVYYLSRACYDGDLKLVKYLLTSPELINKPPLNYWSEHCVCDEPLQMAAMEGQLHIVEYLLTSPELKEHSNIGFKKCEFIDIALKRGFPQIAKFCLTSSLLSDKQVNIINKNIRPIFRSLLIYNGIDLAQDIIDGKYLNIKNKIELSYDNFFLNEAISYNSIPAIKFLIDHGIDINQSYNNNAESLFYAAQREHTELLRFIIFDCYLDEKKIDDSKVNYYSLLLINALFKERDALELDKKLDLKPNKINTKKVKL